MSRLTLESQSMVREFNPRMTYRMVRAELKELLLRGPIFYYGEVWNVKTKHLGAGVYEVTGERAK